MVTLKLEINETKNFILSVLKQGYSLSNNNLFIIKTWWNKNKVYRLSLAMVSILSIDIYNYG